MAAAFRFSGRVFFRRGAVDFAYRATDRAGLMRTVAAVATEALSLCGIPAQLEGSLIRVSTGLVGVNEACSGVRSLQTSLMIGLLFGELKRLSVPKRFALILGALAIAIVANFARAFFLVWIAATQSISAVDRNGTISPDTPLLRLCFAGRLGLTQFSTAQLGEKGEKEMKRPHKPPPATRFRLPPFPFLLCLRWLVARSRSGSKPGTESMNAA